eukprot:SM000059S18692  [mRNA]  locus=s59:486150:487813:+ [translate_table: standard]
MLRIWTSNASLATVHVLDDKDNIHRGSLIGALSAGLSSLCSSQHRTQLDDNLLQEVADAEDASLVNSNNWQLYQEYWLHVSCGYQGMIIKRIGGDIVTRLTC